MIQVSDKRREDTISITSGFLLLHGGINGTQTILGWSRRVLLLLVIFVGRILENNHGDWLSDKRLSNPYRQRHQLSGIRIVNCMGCPMQLWKVILKRLSNPFFRQSSPKLIRILIQDIRSLAKTLEIFLIVIGQ